MIRMGDRMKRRWYLWIAALSMLLAGGIAVWQTWSEKTYKIENVTQAVYRDHTMYGIDLKDNVYGIFRTGEDGKADLVRIPVREKETWLTLSSPETGADNVLYVYGETQNENGRERNVYLVDFKKGCLEKKWTMPDSESGIFWFLYWSESKGLYGIMDRGYSMDWYALNPDGTITLSASYGLPDGNLDLSVGDSQEHRIWFRDQYGNIFVYDESGHARLLFANNGSQAGTDNIHMESDGEIIWFYNITDDCWYEIGADDIGGTVKKSPEKRFVTAESFDRMMMGNTEYCEEEDLYIGILPLPDGRQVPAVYGFREQIYDSVSLEGPAFFLKGCLAFLKTEALLALGFTAFWLIFLRPRRLPLWERILLFIIPVALTGYWWVSSQVNSQMELMLKERHMDLILSFGKTQINNLDMEAFLQLGKKESLREGDEDGLFKTGPYRYTSYYNRKKSSGYGKTDFLLELYYIKDGEIYNATGSEQYNVPLSSVLPSRMYQAMETAVSKNAPAYLEHNDPQGRWISILIPIRDNQNNLAGLMKVTAKKEWEQEESHMDSRRIQTGLLLMTLGILGAVFLLLRFNMRFLDTLLKAVEQAAAGDRSVRVKVRGNSEGAMAGAAFNEMLSKLDESLGGLEAFNEAYQAFLPKRIFHLMGKEGVEEVSLGDETEILTAILTVKHPDLVEQYLERLLPVVRQYTGVTVHISETEVNSIFSGDPAMALQSAVLLIQQNPVLATGLAYGNTRLGIVGGKERQEVAMSSENLRYSHFLAEKAGEYGAGILASQSFMDQVQKFSGSCHIRLLGYIYLTGEGRLEQIFEILDGQEQKNFLLKEETRELFNQGVNWFMSGRFLEARRCFILVLERNQKDRAAAKYSFLCDRYLNGGENGQGPRRICLDEF